VLVFDARRGAAERFRDDMAQAGAPVPRRIDVASTAKEAISGADVVCTATTSSTPVFSDSDLREGTHINAIGSFTPEMQELPAETVARALLVVDSREAAWAEAGDLIIAKKRGLITESSVHAEIGEIVAGTKSGRTGASQVTLFKSVGNAVQDVSVGARILREAERNGLGRVVDL
jgi:ornithine cyclodeaminase